MGIVFLGTPEFAVPTLAAMLQHGYQVTEVITQPDRPKGRRQEISFSPVKEFALAQGLPVYQPERIRRPEAVEHLRNLAPETMVVVGYGQIIPQSVLDIPANGIIYVHASLLPKLRGAAPIQWSIAQGFRVTGVTTMRIDAGLDTGDMLLRAETEIGPEEDAVALSARLAVMGADLLVETLGLLPMLEPEKQNAAEATLAPILKKEDGHIDWHRPAQEIHNLVRGLQPWPGAYTEFRGSRLHIWRCRVSEEQSALLPGSLIGKQRGDTAYVVCGGGTVLELWEVQLEGRKRMAAGAFWNGLHGEQNQMLGVVTS